MRTTTAALAAALLIASLTACGSTDDADAKATSSETPTPAATTSSPEAEPTPTRQPILKLGTTWEFESTEDSGDNIAGTVTVLDYKQGVRSIVSADEDGGTDGYEWAYVELKTCSTSGSFLASVEPWTISYEDGTRVEPSSSTYGDFPKPEYPVETQLTTGRCVRGKLVFPVPGDSWPQNVVYAPYGLDTPQEWAVPTEG